MKHINIYIALLLWSIALSSCQKDTITGSTTITHPEPEIIETPTSLVVYVTDNWGPNPRAFVSVNGQTIQTDERGRAFIKLNAVSRTGDLVLIQADNRIENNKLILLEPGKKNIEYVYLERTNTRHGLESTQDETIFSSTFTLEIPADALEYADGSGLHSGTYSVYYKHFQGDDPNLYAKMPGGLFSSDSEGISGALANFGMLNVNLVAFGGKELRIADDKKVKITFTIPNAQLSEAPSTIPTFWLDEPSGRWIEEGQATLENDKYTFEVSHFTWWACQLYKCIDDIVTVGGTIVLPDGTPCGGCKVTIEGTDASIDRTTSSQGTFSVLSCPDQEYQIYAYHNEINCDNSQPITIGTYSVQTQNIDWGDMIMDDTDLITISGVVYACEVGVTEEGSYIIINHQDIIETTNNGIFEFTACYHPDSMLTIEGFNEEGTLMSEPITLNLSPDGHQDLELSTCLESDIYLIVMRDGQLVEYVGRPVQERICNEGKQICIAVGKEHFEDEYFSAVLELVGDIDLNQVVSYIDADVVPNTVILYSEDVHNNVNNLLARVEKIDTLEVTEFNDYKTVKLKFQAIGGSPAVELNYDIEFRIRI